ncbi:hypothetical protein [Gordonia hirsuta]|uniref:hypothetical protein n=1 Tax=Gordonia hirsuta TaxID=53427 RepID=UPI00034BF23C|nr:hypothetical protein [Gordonia hirsuta]
MTAARTAHDDAVRRERRARIEAAPRLRRQARRRRAGIRLAALAAAVVAVLFALAAVVGAVGRSSDQDELDRLAQARVAAIEAISVMLSADPDDADAYVDRVIAVSAGDQRERLTRARPELRAAIAELGAVSTGRVISAGVQPGAGEEVPVLVVAQASAPELVGGGPGTNRVAVRVLMTRPDQRWLVDRTERVG